VGVERAPGEAELRAPGVERRAPFRFADELDAATGGGRGVDRSRARPPGIDHRARVERIAGADESRECGPHDERLRDHERSLAASVTVTLARRHGYQTERRDVVRGLD